MSEKIIAVAHSARKNLTDMGINKEKICVIINGAEGIRKLSERERATLRESMSIKEDDFVVLICARLEKCKDHETFLRAASILLKSSERYKFIILGTGSRERYLKNLCRALQIEDNVIFAGFARDVSPYMNICDLNVNCSVGTETSSLALSEGMSIGKPCVASDYGGNVYMVRDGENGYVYKAGDCVDLAQKIKAVATLKESSPKGYISLCKGSEKRYLSELNAAEMSKKTQQLYLDMIREKKKRPR